MSRVTVPATQSTHLFEDQLRRTIYVAGYPKSGTTWLTRLLGDALNCPTGGSLPKDDAIEPATEGLKRPGPYVVRKGHFVFTDEQTTVPVPRSHVLAYKALTDEAIVWIHRHPFDVILSVRDYWGTKSIEGAIQHMLTRRAYVPYIRSWLNAPFACVRTRYETLWEDTEGELTRILAASGLPVDEERLPDVVQRQSFEVRKQHAATHGSTLPRGRAYHMRFYRRGKPGHWRTEFTERDVAIAEQHFGDVMRCLGYKAERV